MDVIPAQKNIASNVIKQSQIQIQIPTVFVVTNVIFGTTLTALILTRKNFYTSVKKKLRLGFVISAKRIIVNVVEVVASTRHLYHVVCVDFSSTALASKFLPLTKTTNNLPQIGFVSPVIRIFFLFLRLKTLGSSL